MEAWKRGKKDEGKGRQKAQGPGKIDTNPW